MLSDTMMRNDHAHQSCGGPEQAQDSARPSCSSTTSGLTRSMAGSSRLSTRRRARCLPRSPQAEKADVDKAVKAARKALESGPWSTMDAADRGRLLFKLADLVDQKADELAALESLNCGKTITDSKGDMVGVANRLRYYAGWADKVEGRTVPVRGNFLSYTLRQPVGVVGQIIPWNFPLLMLAWKWGPALACGNTVVMKPAEQTPLTALCMAELAREAGFPPGVINVLNGLGETTGAAIVVHPDIDKIAFTGHVDTAKIIQKAAADTLKRTTFELGGKSPNVVFADADMDAAVEGAFHAIYFHGGQCCTAGSRLFVENKIHERIRRTACREGQGPQGRRPPRSQDPAGPAGLGGAARQDPALRQARRETRGDALDRRRAGRLEGLLCAAHDLRQRQGRDGDRPRRDLRSGRQRPSVQGS